MKTQVRRMKQCVSLFFGFGAVFWPNFSAVAYTSVAPFANLEGPRSGLQFAPVAIYHANDETSTQSSVQGDFNLSGALSSELTAYGRYSTQGDQLIGLNQRFARDKALEFSVQLEGTDSRVCNAGFTLGAFAASSTPIFGISNLTAEVGLGIHSLPSQSMLTIPGSFLVTHHAETSAWLYGGGFVGENNLSDGSLWIAVRALLAYETKTGVRYGLEIALPATEQTSENSTALAFHLTVPFGAAKSSEDFAPTVANKIVSTEPPRYDLDAKVISQNEALFLIKIDKGSSDSISKGQTFDIYAEGTKRARAEVIAVKKDEAALNVLEYNQEAWIELGFSARRISTEKSPD